MTFQFWQSWPRSSRIFLLVFSILFGVALVAMWSAWTIEPSPALELQNVTEADLGEVTVDQFSKGPYNFTVRGNNYVVFQRQLGGMLETSNAVAYGYLFFLAVFMIGMLAVISTLSKFYYLMGMGIFILFVTTLGPEVLGVFGIYGRTFSLVIMAMYGLSSFWLFYFASTTGFLTRVLVFTAVTALLASMIYFLSATPSPFLFLAAHATEAGILACMLFIITVAHEIIAGFIYAVSQSTRSGKTLNHFLIITMIYIANLVLTYAVRFGFLDWDIIAVNLYLLLTISGILGIWGIRMRQKTYEGIIGETYAVYAFILVGMFSFASIATFMLNANDTALASISDIIIFTHIGFGVAFLLYLFSNFMAMLAKNYAVYKVLYTPNNMPYVTFRLGGIAATAALLIYNTWQVPVHNAQSGYYNALADLYHNTGNDRVARLYFDESRTYGFKGHHANYALANLEGAAFALEAESSFYNDASNRRPTPMSVLNWAQTFQQAEENLEAIIALESSLKKDVSDKDAIENTIGLLYGRTGMPDSAIKYLELSKTSGKYGSMASANLVGLAAMGRVPVSGDTASATKDYMMIANRLALVNRYYRPWTKSFELPADTAINLGQAMAISNYLINKKDQVDTALIRKVIALARRPSNIGYKEGLLFASSLALYSSGETKEAFRMLEEVTVESDHQGKYNNILTMWSLENNEPKRAIGYAEYAVDQDYAPAKVAYAVALTEAGRFAEAVAAWDSVISKSDTISSKLARDVRDVLTQPATATKDSQLQIYSRYKLTLADTNRIFLLLNNPDKSQLGKALMDLAEKCYAMDEPIAAQRVLNQIIELQLDNLAIRKQINWMFMMLQLRFGNLSTVETAISENSIQFTGKEKKYKIYFDALSAEAAKDTATASRLYKWLGTADPFFEDGVIRATEYFKDKGQTSYDMLVEAILYHPSSIRLRIAYALESARQGYDDYARGSLMELKPRLDPKKHAEITKAVLDVMAERSAAQDAVF